jgi:hypothetical protein
VVVALGEEVGTIAATTEGRIILDLAYAEVFQ